MKQHSSTWTNRNIPRALVVQWEEDSLAIVTDKANHLGQTLLQAGQPPNARVCLSVNVPSLQEELIRVLNR